MKQFQVYYDEFLVGVVYINEEGQYKYICNKKILEKIAKSTPVAPALYQEQVEFGPEIPYFKVRLEANENNKNIEIGLINDRIRLKEF